MNDDPLSDLAARYGDEADALHAILHGEGDSDILDDPEPTDETAHDR